MPLVSIVIPTLNRPDYLREAIQSCLNQSFKDIAVYVVDNASDDLNAVKDVCSVFDDSRLIYQRYEERLPIAESWTRALSLVDSEFAKILCDDDLISPNYVEIGLKAFSLKTEAVLFTSGCLRTASPDVNLLPVSRGECWWIPRNAVSLLIYLDLIGGGLPTQTMFRISALKKLDPFFDGSRFLDACDSGCWIELLRHGGLLIYNSSLVLERQHPGQQQKTWTESHYVDVFTRLKDAAWTNIDEKIKKTLPDPSKIVGSLSFIMRLRGRFPRRFHYSDLKYLVCAASFIIRTRRRSINNLNKVLRSHQRQDRCSSFELS